MKRAVFFDLDGTLLGMDMESFIRDYLGRLAKMAAPLGYNSELLIDAMWTCTAAMIQNDGSCTNYERFWSGFAEVFGEKVYDDIPTFDAFYRNEFHAVKDACVPDADSAHAAVAAAREWADVVVLSTNPIFPRDAVLSRLSWVGLKEEDFDYITTYDNSTLCKPNPDYYRRIIDKLGLVPEEITMVGNDMQEDMLASAAAGITKRYYVTDHAINRDNTPATMPHGSLREFPAWLKAQ